MPHLFRAAWVLPIARPPIRDGWVAVEDGRIVGVGGPAESAERSEAASAKRDRERSEREARGGGAPRALSNADRTPVPDIAILPGLVNAHTHLELSHLHRRVPPSASFNDWVHLVMATRRQYPDPEAPEILEAARAGISAGLACGTSLFGEVSNTLVTVPLLRDAGARARVFYEILGFNATDPAARVVEARRKVHALAAGDDVRVSLAPHAPYSVAPPLFGAIRAALECDEHPVTSVHLGESREETEFVRHGTGPIRVTLEDFGVWTDEWTAVLPAGTSPVEYLTRLGFLAPWVNVVHGVQFDEDDLARLREIGSTVVTCPRSNAHVGAGSPPIERFYASGVRVAIGTDSLASVEDLNVFEELKEMRRLAPTVPASRLLESATRCGAEALGFGRELGTIEPGKRAALVGVHLPEGVTDVEEYLVGGVPPHDVFWVGSRGTACID
jgi:cytosine/adenosine deaminase-related metal-dependent hydrolase